MILVSVTGSDGFAQAMTDLRNKPVLYTTQGRIEAKVIHHGPSPYGEIVVFDYGADHVRCLLLEGANESCWNFSARSPSEYTRHIAQLLKRFKTERSLRDVLVIGFGAGTLLKDLEGSGLNIEAVEINPKILEVGEAYFGAPQDIEYAVRIDDGRHFMTTTDRRYDAIVLDLCYVSSANVHLWTKEFYALAAARLNDPQRGVVIASRGTTDELRSKELDHMIANAMRESFEHLYRVKRSEEGSGSFDMSVFVASGKELDAARGGPPELERWDFRPEYKAADDNSYQDLLELFWPATVAIRDQAAENFGKEILLPRL